MDEYIKRKDVLTALDYVGFDPETAPIPLTLAVARKHVRRIPSADVVPRSELERVNVELDAMRGAANSYKLHYENARKEIGEEIYRIIGDGDNETWICLLIRKLADNLTGKGEALNAETCVVCGNVIPEGRQVCPTCERRTIKK